MPEFSINDTNEIVIKIHGFTAIIPITHELTVKKERHDVYIVTADRFTGIIMTDGYISVFHRKPNTIQFTYTIPVSPDRINSLYTITEYLLR